MITVLFWSAVFFIVYTYIGFPLFVILRGLLLDRPSMHKSQTTLPSVSIIISAYNEAETIALKLNNILLLDYPREKLEVVIASSSARYSMSPSGESSGSYNRGDAA